MTSLEPENVTPLTREWLDGLIVEVVADYDSNASNPDDYEERMAITHALFALRDRILSSLAVR